MLRTVVFFVTLAVVVIGIILCVMGVVHAWPILCWSGVLLVAMLCEQWRYRHQDDGPRGGWEPTDERFVDVESGALMQVMYNPHTGERRYVRAISEGRSDSNSALS